MSAYLRAVCDGWRWVCCGLIVALFSVSGYFLIAPSQFRSEVTFLVQTPGDVSQVVDGGDAYARARARTYAAMADTVPVAESVVDDRQLVEPARELAARFRGTPRAGTALFTVTVTDDTADRAAQVAAAFARNYQHTVADLETVPGSVVPRADLVVVDPPSSGRRVTPWGVPARYLVLAAALAGLLAGATAAVLASVHRRPPSGLTLTRHDDMMEGSTDQT